MNSFPFRCDSKLTEVLKAQKFTVSAEVIPPRNGTEQTRVLGQIHSLVQSGAQFLAVTKGAGGSLRGGSLPIAHLIKERFSVPCVAHFTCRDLSAFEVENELMDHHYLGIRNILALRGDPPDGQGQWEPKEGGYRFAYELIHQIRDLNRGHYLSRVGGPLPEGLERTDFCIGAAAYPDYPHEADRIEFFRMKVEAGAEFGISDMLFDADSYARFLDQCEKNRIDVPILPGTRILKSRKQALRISQKFKVNIPSALVERLPEETQPDSIRRGVDLFQELTERLRRLGAPGIHLYIVSDAESASVALSKIGTEF